MCTADVYLQAATGWTEVSGGGRAAGGSAVAH